MQENSFSDQNIDEPWLKNWLTQEISIMRELLSNLLQEEIALIMWDEMCWNQVIMERSLIIEKLKNLREQKKPLKESFIALFADLCKSNSECELKFLKEQVLALTEKTASQNMRNHKLFETYGPSLGKPLHERADHLPQPALQKAKRVRVITLDQEE